MTFARTLTALVEVLGVSSPSQLRKESMVNVLSDPNCGAAFNSAIDDTVGGLLAGCSQTNPSNSVSKPSSSPACQ